MSFGSWNSIDVADSERRSGDEASIRTAMDRLRAWTRLPDFRKPDPVMITLAPAVSSPALPPPPGTTPEGSITGPHAGDHTASFAISEMPPGAPLPRNVVGSPSPRFFAPVSFQWFLYAARP